MKNRQIKHSYTKDIKIGDKFGKLTTVLYDSKRYQWLCDCDCGGTTYIVSNKLISGQRTSCICSRGLGKKIKNGDKFGKLIVLNFDKKKQLWHCKCECGNENYTKSNHLKRGLVKSCGCNHIGPQFHIRRPNNESLKLDLMWVYRNATKKSNRQFELSKEKFYDLISDNCYYCGSKPNSANKRYLKYDSNFRYNGIDRVDNSKGYLVDNCVTCCEICNRAKLTMSLEEFKNWIKKVYDKQK